MVLLKSRANKFNENVRYITSNVSTVNLTIDYCDKNNVTHKVTNI